MTAGSVVRPAPSVGRKKWGPALLLGALVLVAVALRFWRLGDWNFEATEIFTHRDSIREPRITNPRPLIYFLNYYVVGPFLPLDEFGLRVLPALFGVLAIPTLYLIGRRLIGVRAALLGALLLTVSPLHVFYSQFARYWSAVFLFSAVYPFALYLGVRDRDRRATAVGLVTGVLAVLAHPVAVLLVGGPAIWFAATLLRPARLRALWNERRFRWGVLVAAVLAGLVAVRMVPVLQHWISLHDKNPGSGEFLLRVPGGAGPKQVFYVLAFVESLSLPVVLAALLGIGLLWQRRDRQLAIFLTSLAAFPLAFLTLISLRTPVSQYYLLPTVPVFFLAAGVFLDEVFGTEWNLRPRWLIPAALTAIVLTAGAPTLISFYRDGRRYDFRGIAHWMQGRVAQGDAVFSDQPMVLAHYLRGARVQRLRDPAALEESLGALRRSPQGEAVWVVAPARSHAFRTSPKLGSLNRWVYDNCRLRNTIGVGRVDFRQHYLQVYRCAAAGTADGGATSE